MPPMSPEDIRQYLASHRVLALVHQALNAAVSDQAANPLLHTARTLRTDKHLVPPILSGVAASATTPPTEPEAAHQLLTSPPLLLSTQKLQAADGGRLEAVQVTSEEQLHELLVAEGIDLSGALGPGHDLVSAYGLAVRFDEHVWFRVAFHARRGESCLV